MNYSWIRKSGQCLFLLFINVIIITGLNAQGVEDLNLNNDTALVEVEDGNENENGQSDNTNSPINNLDGKSLFKSNCAACHHPIKNSTGPKLQGVRQAWIDAGEGENIYKWVQNSPNLISSGSVMAEQASKFSPAGMPPQSVSNEEIDAIFRYIDEEYQTPTSTEGSELTQTEGAEDSGAYWWYLIAGLLLIVLFTILGTRKKLAHLIDEQEGKEINIDKSIADNIREWALRNWLIVTLLIVVTLIALGVDLFGRLYQVGIFEDYQPSQPIAYSHKLHAGDMGIDCKYCHHSAEKSKHAGIPSTNVCMNCHNTIFGSSSGAEEIDKIHKAAGYDKQTKEYSGEEQPIVWNKAHNLPDHVFFSHAQHVNPNTGNINCAQCHGDVKSFTLGRVATVNEINEFSKTEEGKGILELSKPLLTMGWCIECHNKKEIDLTSNAYYIEMHERMKNRPDYMRSIKEDKKVTVREMGGWECAKCHY